jgi:hypothetical protein
MEGPLDMTKHAKPDPAPPDTQAKPKSEQPSGGIAFDERGNAIWKWRSDIDTQQVKAIQESSEASFSIDEPAKQPVIHGRDPYSTAAPPPRPFEKTTPATPEKKPQRRTLDDMRRLSEEIKRQRALKKP